MCLICLMWRSVAQTTILHKKALLLFMKALLRGVGESKWTPSSQNFLPKQRRARQAGLSILHKIL